MSLLYHCQEEIEIGRVVRDGQFDATILEETFIRADTLYLIKHGLGRPVKQYQVVFSDLPVRVPGCPRDPLTGERINDAERIGLVFTETNITIRLRFS